MVYDHYDDNDDDDGGGGGNIEEKIQELIEKSLTISNMQQNRIKLRNYYLAISIPVRRSFLPQRRNPIKTGRN